MEIALLLVVLAVVVLTGTTLSDRFGLPAPLLLIAVGAVGSYLPLGTPVHLEPEVVLLGLLPPLLYTAALHTSLVDFRANRRPIGFLSVSLVVVTTAAVGLVAQALVPGLGWPAALAIGAVVAPPDAVAATAIARRIGLPRRVVTVLEGESLVNDATALVALRMAIAALAAPVTAAQVGLDFLRAAGGGALVGVATYLLVARVRRHITNPTLDTSLSFVVPYAAYLAAESFHGSGVIAVVAAGLLLGHKAPLIQTAQSRMTERATWGAIAFLLENTVFLLIGLQARGIMEAVGASSLSAIHIVGVCAAVLGVVMVVRITWLFVARVPLWRRSDALARRESLVVGWAGMRGVVTLAAAFVLPAATPHREVLQLVAFTVVAGTLFLQGLSLPWLTRRLGIAAPDPAVDAIARAGLLEQAGQAGLARLAELADTTGEGVGDLVRKRIEARNFAAWERLGTGDREPPSAAYARVRLAVLAAEREHVLRVRSSGQVPSEVVSEVLGVLDLEESIVAGSVDRQEEVRTAGLRFAPGGGCDDLRAHPAGPSPEGAVCEQCLANGTTWVALRRCLDCGHVGCCDSSPGRHATAHFRESLHPVMQSAEPGELWRWCYVHHLTG